MHDHAARNIVILPTVKAHTTLSTIARRGAFTDTVNIAAKKKEKKKKKKPAMNGI